MFPRNFTYKIPLPGLGDTEKDDGKISLIALIGSLSSDKTPDQSGRQDAQYAHPQRTVE
jgi:hypothetical protein